MGGLFSWFSSTSANGATQTSIKGPGAEINVSTPPTSTTGTETGRGWLAALLGLFLILGFIAFILVMILWFQGQSLKRKTDKIWDKCCCKLSKCVAGIKDGSNVMLGNWSFVSTTLTGTVALQPMLFSAATPQGTTLVDDSQLGTSSLLRMPWNGSLTALSLQVSSIPSAGDVVFTVMKNGLATTLTSTVATTTTSPILYTLASPLVTFDAGDTIGISFATVGLTMTIPPTFNAQLYANFVC